jgi:hypothetical protein
MLYIKRNVEKVWGARYLSKNTVIKIFGMGRSVKLVLVLLVQGL